MGERDRKALLAFLKEIDDRFFPPLSSPLHRGFSSWIHSGTGMGCSLPAADLPRVCA